MSASPEGGAADEAGAAAWLPPRRTLPALRRAARAAAAATLHFKWQERGKRRIHQRPSRWEIVACGPLLAAELEVVEPDVVVLMGAVAASSLMGPSFRVTRERGRVIAGPSGLPTVATVHPASILRGRPGDRERAPAAFASDLRVAAPAAA